MAITCKLDFKCKLCGHTKFYVSPVGTKTISKDIIYTLKEFKLVCKKCNKTYILDYKIRVV